MAEAVCDEDTLPFFSPTSHWWLLSNSKKAQRNFPAAVAFLDQIGVTEDDMKAAFASEWRRIFDTRFPQFVVRKWKEVNWVTVKHLPGTVNDKGESITENGAPDYNNIVTTTDMKIASDALRRNVERWAAMFDGLADKYQWDEDYLADCLLGIKVMTRSGVASEIAARKSGVPALSLNVLGAAKKGSAGPDPQEDGSGGDDGRPAVPTAGRRNIGTSARGGGGGGAEGGMADVAGRVGISAARRPVAPDADAATAPAAPDANVGAGAIGQSVNSLRAAQPESNIDKIVGLTNILNGMRDRYVPQGEQKAVTHLVHEGIQLLKEGDTVTITPKSGGTANTWQRVIGSRGGTSASTVSRVSSQAKSFVRKSTGGRHKSTRADIEKNVAADLESVIVEFDSKNNQIIVPDELDQLQIMQIAGTDRKMNKLNGVIARITGFRIGRPNFSLAKATESNLPSFIISTEELLVDGKKEERRTFRVKSISEAICSEVVGFINGGGFIESSSICKKDDDTIMIRFLGDKGGTFMQFKFGFSIMNQPSPNSTAAFEVIGSMEAFDTYYNLNAAMFCYWEEELAMLFGGNDNDYADAAEPADGKIPLPKTSSIQIRRQR